MAPRSVAEDQIQSFRFRVFEGADGAGVFAGEEPVAGFNNITTPNLTFETAEHRTGIEKYTRKFLGIPTWEDCTMTRGVLVGDTTFYDWAINKYLNKSPFRTDLSIRVYNQEGDGWSSSDDAAVRGITMRNCIPTSVKILGDLDASASDVNIQEITCATEEVELEEVPAALLP